MLSETGRVVAVEDGAVWVETVRQSTCGSCEARVGCGHQLLGSIGRQPTLVRALTPGRGSDLAVHDEVRISVPEGRFLRGVMLLYLLPLVAALGAALAAGVLLVRQDMSAAQADLRSSAAALGGLALGLLFARWRSRRARNDAALNPVVTERL